MEPNLSLFNQINSLSYWFLFQSEFKCSVFFDTDRDSFFVTIKENGQPIYSHKISRFSQQNPRILHFELVAIANSLVHLKESIRQQKRAFAI